MIRIEGLNKRYGSFKALTDLNLHIAQGEIFGYVGPNGAGKTTTIKILSGLLAPTSGTVRIEGIDVTRDRNRLKREVGYMPDYFGIYDAMTVWEYLDFFGAAYRIGKHDRQVAIERALDLASASHMAQYYLDALSRGMRQKVNLARTLIHDPKVLLLDEPASGLDPRARIEMRNLLKNLKGLGKTILLSSHILSELSISCDRLGFIQKGVLGSCGTPTEIVRSLNDTLRVEAEFVTAPGADIVGTVSSMEGVTPISVEENVLTMELAGGLEAVEQLHAALHQLPERLLWFREVVPSMEEAFMRISGDEGVSA